MARLVVATLVWVTATFAVPAAARDFATVGRIVVRSVDGRTVVLVPIKGPIRLALSEPYRLSNRSRLYLTVVDARLAIRNAPPRKGQGLLDLAVEEIGADVRIAFELSALGTYEMKPTEGGILLTLDPTPRERRAAEAAARAEAVALWTVPAPVRQAPLPEPDGAGYTGLIVLVGLAALTGLVVRKVRRDGTPHWVERLAERVRPLFARLRNTAPATSPDSTPEVVGMKEVTGTDTDPVSRAPALAAAAPNGLTETRRAYAE